MPQVFQSSRALLPSPFSLIASALVLVAALILLGLAALHWRHARRLAPIRTRRVVIAWGVVGTAYALWGLALLGLGGLSLTYPFDGRTLILPPGPSVGLALEVFAYALVPTGAVVLAIGRALLQGAYRSLS
jgi:hypothetical protein